MSLSHKLIILYLVVAAPLLGQHSLSLDELKDTHIGRIECIRNCMGMQFFAKLHTHPIVHAICEGMQSCQYGHLSTRLDSMNAFLGDERPQLKKTPFIFEIKIRMEFPLYFFEFSIIK